mgnify:CR=1 FL=1
MEKVKAAVLVEPEKIEIQEFDKPSIQADAMLFKIELAGVCGTDVHLYHGREKSLQYPVILGHEFSAVISEMGEKAARTDVHGLPLETGDRITIYNSNLCGKCYYCRFTARQGLCPNFSVAWGFTSCRKPPHLLGAWAEYMYIFPNTWIFKVPEDMSAELNTLTEPMATASRAIERAIMPGIPSLGEGLGPAKTVVVQGSGAIGLLSAVVAKILGAGKVILVGAPAGRLKISEQFNVDQVINIEEITKPEDRINIVKRLCPFTGGADIVVEATGVPAAVPEGIAMLRPGGTFIEVGHYVDRGTVPINPYLLCSKDINLYGSYGFSQYNMETAIHLLYDNKDKFPFEKIITHKFALYEASDAVRAAEKGEALKSSIKP